MSALIAEHQPDELAIEEPYVAANVRSAFAIGEARAAAMIAAAAHGIEVFQYQPAAVKAAVTGYGGGAQGAGAGDGGDAARPQ